MRFGLLGPLVIGADDGRVIDLRGLKVRTLAVALLCRANQPVPADALIDAVWGAAPPRQAASALRVYVHHLRQSLGEQRIRRRAEGYELLVEPGELDVDRFRDGVAAGRDALARADLARASTAFQASLALWRGPALAGFERVDAFSAEAYGLDELRLDALEQRFEAELGLGRHAEICAELRELSARYPLRETISGQLMRALVACGRSAEALTVFEQTRRLLADELGLDPGPQLCELHLNILRQRQSPPDTPGHVVPRQLPAALTGFVGRADALGRLDTLLPGRAAATGTAVITGTAGIGKTTLAVYWAHRVADRFPDGQLYLNLHGFDPLRSPMEPDTAIGLFLGALGVPPKRVPVGLEARESLYRSLLADRRVLVVLDNAHDARQVRPLLPGSSGCLVVVTSRNLLTGLVAAGAYPIVLDMLTPTEAGNLVRRRLGVDRTEAEPAAIEEIVNRCAGLPLPLSIVTARAATMERTPLATLAGELGRARRALDGFASDDATIDLRAVFSWSYRVLSDRAARLFRLLALHPGPDVSEAAAASTAALPVDVARTTLAELTAANLLTGSATGRFGYHDLLRAYAIELVEEHESAAERREAVRRMVDHYVHTANPATVFLDSRHTPTEVEPAAAGVTPEELADAEQAVAWFAAERATLLAVVDIAGDGFDAHVWQLVWSFATYLDRFGYWRDKVEVQLAAVAAARRAHNRPMEAHILRGLGRTYGRLRDFGPAHGYTRAALELYRALGDRYGQAKALGTLTEFMELEGKYTEALDLADQAYGLFRAIGHRTGQAQALNTMGFMHTRLGDHDLTIDASRRALALFIEVEDRIGQGASLDSIGFAYHNLGRYQEAISCFRQALDALADAGFGYFTAITLDHLGDAQRAAGDTGAARHSWQRALTIFTSVRATEAAEVAAKLAAVGG